MSHFICCLWWFVLGVFVGWLLSWLLNRLFGRSRVQEVSAPAPPQPAVAASRADDLTKIEGIGPKIAELLRGHGIDSFATLSRTDVAKLWSILDEGRSALQSVESRDLAGAGGIRHAGRLGRLEELSGQALRRNPALRRHPGRGRHRRGGGEGGGLRPEGARRPGGRRGHRAEDLASSCGSTASPRSSSSPRRRPPRSRPSSQKGGPDFRVANPGTWPEQAGYCVRNDWAGLKKLQDRLTAGRE